MEHQEFYRDYQITVRQEISPHDPMDGDLLGDYYIFSHRHKLGNKDVTELGPAGVVMANKGAFFFDVYMLEHGQVALSLEPFNVEGGGKIGIAVVPPDKYDTDVNYEYSELHDRVKLALEAELSHYNQYLCADVYRYEIAELKKCETCGHIREA